MAPALIQHDVDSQSSPGVKVSKAHCSAHILHRDLKEVPHQVIKGEGLYLHLSNGRSIIDATGGAAVACLGHGNASVQKAVIRQMSQFSYCHSFFFGSRATEELGTELIRSTNGKMEKAFILSSGM